MPSAWRLPPSILVECRKNSGRSLLVQCHLRLLVLQVHSGDARKWSHGRASPAALAAAFSCSGCRRIDCPSCAAVVEHLGRDASSAVRVPIVRGVRELPTSMRQANSAATGWTDQVSARGAAARVKLRAPCPTTPATAARAKPKLRRLRLQQVGGRYSAPSLCCSARPRSSGACVLAAEPTGTQLCPSRP